MIDLRYSPQRMLDDIRAPAHVATLRDLGDPAARAAFVGGEAARLVTRVHAPHEILPALDGVLAARFAAVEPERLRRDLLLPLKKAVGNAHKRGNLRDPGKWITLEVLVTRTGALVQVTDEGVGFDVAATCERFRAGARYFTHGGSGFRKYEKARAIVSFDDGGRTFRVCFRVDPDRAPSGVVDGSGPAHENPVNGMEEWKQEERR